MYENNEKLKLMNIDLNNFVISIITRRGRSFMLTTAFGFLLSGPIESIDTNVQEVVRAITCLYQQVSMNCDRNQGVKRFQNR